jgi:hypothetical protein
VFLILAILLGWLTPVCADPLTVKEFNDKLEAWKAAEKDPSALTLEVEGRVKLYANDRIAFEHCKVRFVSKKALPERINRTQNVVVVGKVSRDPKTHEYGFQITSLRFVPSENDQFADKLRQTKQSSPEDWYALGRWAQLRGDFYGDDKLVAHAIDANRHGLEIERKSIGKADAEGLKKLAAKAKKFGVARLEDEWLHEAFRIEFDNNRSASPAEISGLADSLAAAFPKARDQLDSFPRELVADYQRRPLETYKGADSSDRRKLIRWLFTELQLRLITHDLAADAGNGFEIAERIDRVVRDRHEVAEEYRDNAMKTLAASVEKLSRSQVLELVDRYRFRGREREATEFLESWLKVRQKALDPDDTEGLINLSDDCRQQLKNAELADRLLLEAWANNPKARDIQERLEKAGYRLIENQWISEKEFVKRPEGKLEKAIREGLVEPGMTAAQVRRSRGQPKSVARAATSGQVTELWTYKFADSSQIVVRFVKRASQSEMTVVEVVDDMPH